MPDIQLELQLVDLRLQKLLACQGLLEARHEEPPRGRHQPGLKREDDEHDEASHRFSEEGRLAERGSRAELVEVGRHGRHQPPGAAHPGIPLN
eukprot:scaffold395_cov243-Pinguiococcus_pyrenoidosus.AAC.30